MYRVVVFIGLICGAALFPACKKEAASATADVVADDGEPKQAQGKLPTVKLWVGPGSLTAEMAVTYDQMRTGMMYRTNIGEDEAMLFAFPNPTRVSFWMEHTVIPLSAAYITPEGTIAEIHDFKALDTNNIVAGEDDIQFVIETSNGWFARHNVSTGMVIRTEQGTLLEMYHGK